MRLLRNILVTALLCGTLSPAHARVFIRWPGGANINASLEHLGGKAAYRAPVIINGGRGDLAVYGFQDALGTTASQIRRLLKLTPEHTPRNALTEVYLLQNDKQTTRLVLISLPQQSRLLAITIKQSNTEYAKSRQPPPNTEIIGIPPYPGSTPQFQVTNQETGLTLATAKTTAPPGAVAAFYNAALTGAGWKPYLAQPGRGAVTQLALYQQGANICYVLATPSATDKQSTTISILRKKLK